jgi:hypothetical protein
VTPTMQCQAAEQIGEALFGDSLHFDTMTP